MTMKSENIQSNTSAPYLAGRAFGTFHTETALTIVNRLLKDAKAIHTAQDMKDYCNGYKETLSGSTGSKETKARRVSTRCPRRYASPVLARLRVTARLNRLPRMCQALKPN